MQEDISKHWQKQKELYLNLLIQNMLMKLKLNLRVQQDFNVWCKIILSCCRIAIEWATQASIKGSALQLLRMILKQLLLNTKKVYHQSQLVPVKPNSIISTERCCACVEHRSNTLKSRIRRHSDSTIPNDFDISQIRNMHNSKNNHYT